MPFVGEIFAQLKAAAETKVLLEIRDGQVTGVTGGEFLELIRRARTFLASKGLKKGEPLRAAGGQQHPLDGAWIWRRWPRG